MPTARKKLAPGQRRNTKYWGTPKSRRKQAVRLNISDVNESPSNDCRETSNNNNLPNDESVNTERYIFSSNGWQPLIN